MNVMCRRFGTHCSISPPMEMEQTECSKRRHIKFLRRGITAPPPKKKEYVNKHIHVDTITSSIDIFGGSSAQNTFCIFRLSSSYLRGINPESFNICSDYIYILMVQNYLSSCLVRDVIFYYILTNFVVLLTKYKSRKPILHIGNINNFRQKFRHLRYVFLE